MIWPDSTVLWLKGSTCVEFDKEPLSRLKITTGALLASVAPRERRDFAIQAPLGTVRVHGTVFAIRVRNETVTVRLHEGNVTFERPGKKTVLSSGESLHVEKGKKESVSLIDESGLLQDLMIAERTAELSGPPVPVLGRNIAMAPLDVVAKRPQSASRPSRPSPQKRPAQRLPASLKSSPSNTPDAGEALFVDPELQAIDVIHQSTLPRHLLIESLIRKRDYKNCIVEAEKALAFPAPDINSERVLYLKGYCEMRAGNLKAGREAFEHYLIPFPSGRRQKRIQEILGE
jgi:hypothetical protein